MTKNCAQVPRPDLWTSRRAFVTGGVLTLTGAALNSPLGREAAAALAPSAIGAWSPVMPGKAVAIHIALLANGKIVLWQDAGTPKGQPEPPNTLAFLVDMAPGKLPGLSDWTAIPNNTVDLFCAGQTLLADGRVFVVGGQYRDYYFGIRDASIFDPSTKSWVQGSKMAFPRWYPSVITLPNGEVLALSGTMQGSGDANEIPEIWNPANGKWRELLGAKSKTYSYPWLSLDPKTGRVYMAGPQGSKFISTAGAGKLAAGPPRKFALRSAGTFAVHGPGRILAVGGGDANTYRTAEWIDLTAGTPSWTQTGSMKYGRRYATATTLPDGTVLVTGGGENQIGPEGVLPAELWNPETGIWSPLALMTNPRLYHSIALLLPDGRVMVGGGGRMTSKKVIDYSNLEFFSPPYLFNGERPSMTSAPARIAYGETFGVRTPDASGIAAVSIVRLGALTHAVNASQVFYPAKITRGAGIINVTAPPTANYAPPGFYMLFLLNEKKVPSIAKILQIR